MASIEQAAANLAAALKSGNAQDSEAALASYADATDGAEEVPEADLQPIKRDLGEVIAENEERIEEEGADEGAFLAAMAGAKAVNDEAAKAAASKPEDHE